MSLQQLAPSHLAVPHTATPLPPGVCCVSPLAASPSAAPRRHRLLPLLPLLLALRWPRARGRLYRAAAAQSEQQRPAEMHRGARRARQRSTATPLSMLPAAASVPAWLLQKISCRSRRCVSRLRQREIYATLYTRKHSRPNGWHSEFEFRRACPGPKATAVADALPRSRIRRRQRNQRRPSAAQCCGWFSPPPATAVQAWMRWRA